MGPMLFITYINHLDIELVSEISKIASDTNLDIIKDDESSIKQLQRDRTKLP